MLYTFTYTCTFFKHIAWLIYILSVLQQQIEYNTLQYKIHFIESQLYYQKSLRILKELYYISFKKKYSRYSTLAKYSMKALKLDKMFSSLNTYQASFVSDKVLQSFKWDFDTLKRSTLVNITYALLQARQCTKTQYLLYTTFYRIFY